MNVLKKKEKKKENQIRTHTHSRSHTYTHNPVQNAPINENRKKKKSVNYVTI